MSDASEFARELSRARWGTTKVDGLIREVAERSNKLGPSQLEQLRQAIREAEAAAKDQQ